MKSPHASPILTPSIEQIATKGLFGEKLTSLEILELCAAVMTEIAIRRPKRS